MYFRRRQWHPTPVLLPRKFHGWRSLVGYSPWDHKESDTTERIHFQFTVSKVQSDFCILRKHFITFIYLFIFILYLAVWDS